MRTVSAIVAGVVLGLAPALAGAQPPSRTLLSCIIRVSPIDFGPYDPTEPAEATSVGHVLVRCPGAVVRGGVKVTLSAGYSGSLLDRTMLSGTGELHYNLFIDPARQFVAGDGTQGSSPLQQAFAVIGVDVFRFYGAIQPRQSVPAGEYMDDVQVEVTF